MQIFYASITFFLLLCVISSLKDNSTKVKDLYTYDEIKENTIHEKNLKFLNDQEFFIFEILTHTDYYNFAVGGWIRDRVFILFIYYSY